MNGQELRAKRLELRLLQGNLAAQLQELGLKLPTGQKIDQPSISQMERGHIEVPADVAAALEAGRVRIGNDDPPIVGQPRAPRDDGERQSSRKKRVRKRADKAAETSPASAAPSPSAAQTGEQPPAAEQPDAPEPAPPAATLPSDRPPATAVAVRFSEEARSQLERDLRDLFAGKTFLVPVEIQTGDPEAPTRIEHHDAMIPGLAQVVSAFNHHDGRVIELNAASMARAWADLAAENAAVRRFLMAATYGGAWRGVIAATLPVVVAIAANHGMGIPGFLGGPPSAPAAPQPPPGADGQAFVGPHGVAPV